MTPSGAVNLFLCKTEINEKEGSSAKAQPKNKERRRTRMNVKCYTNVVTVVANKI